MPSFGAMPPKRLVRERERGEEEESEPEIVRKPVPPKHATKPTLVQPSQRLSADSKRKLTPSPLSVASFPKMSSPAKDRVTEDGHLQTDAVGFGRPGDFESILRSAAM